MLNTIIEALYIIIDDFMSSMTIYSFNINNLKVK